MRKINKKASTLSGWTEVIALSILFLFAFAIIVYGINSKYNTNIDPSLGMGLQESANTTLGSFKNLQTTFQSSLGNGSASFTQLGGLIVTTSYEVLITVIQITWSVISGGWILKSVALMRLPDFLGTIFQLIYLLGVGFIFLKILFKIRT